MKPLRRIREKRAALVCVVADRYHVIASLIHEPLDGLRVLPADIDADLGHRLCRERTHLSRLRARALDIEAVAGQRAQKSLGHLAPGRVVRADEEDSRLAHSGTAHLSRPLGSSSFFTKASTLFCFSIFWSC